MYTGQAEKYIAAVFVFGNGAGTVGINLTRHLAAFDGTSVAADSYKIVMPRSGTLKNLSLKALPASTINGTGHSVEVLINGASAPTPLLVTWNSPPAGTPPYAPPMINTASVNAGDVISVRLKTKGTSGTLSRPTVSFELEVDADYPNPWDFDPNTNAISYSGGDVEIGTPTSNDALTVHGMIETNEGIRFPDGSIQVEAASPAAGALHSLDAADGNPVDALFVAAGGNVGIGIDPTDRYPQAKLTLAPDSNFATEMPTPSGVVAASQAGGGLAADDYYFRVAASDGTGWTKASAQLLFNLAGSNGIRISWNPVLGATNYRVYRALTATGTYKFIETLNPYYDYLSDAAFTATGSPPEETTAYINKLSAAGDSWLLGGNVGIGTSNPQATLDVNGAISGFGIVPIGSIIAWHKSLSGTPALPDGWVECNGQPYTDSGSPFNDQVIPNLNGYGSGANSPNLNTKEKMFLRGGTTSGIGQADAFQGHRHSITAWGYVAGSQCQEGSGFTINSTIVGDSITDGVNGTPRTANETRPVNMSVVWIMRVK